MKQWITTGQVIKINCSNKCKEDGPPHNGMSYNNIKWCKHCNAAMPLELLRCFCCGHKLRTKSHYYKRKV